MSTKSSRPSSSSPRPSAASTSRISPHPAASSSLRSRSSTSKQRGAAISVKLIAPAFGGINLEDIAAPRCFEVEERLRKELDIPVFHDDQHGTAVVVLAALLNALRIVKRDLRRIRVVVTGVGAAGTATIN